MRRYAREWEEIWKKQSSRVLSHDLLLGKQNTPAKEVYSTKGFLAKMIVIMAEASYQMLQVLWFCETKRALSP